MTGLMVTSGTQQETTMTSLELLKVINKYRLEDGKSEMKHYTFMEKVVSEFGEAAQEFLGGYKDVNNQQRKCYNLPKRECTIMAMRESSYVRNQTMDYIESLEKQVSTLSLPDFTNPAEAAIAWAEQYKAKELLQVEVAKKEEQLVIAAPKVEFYEEVGDVSTTQTFLSVAKAFGCGRNKMLEKLREMKILMSNNTPYQRYCNIGLFRVVQKVGNNFMSNTTYVTGKGEIFLFKKLKECGFL